MCEVGLKPLIRVTTLVWLVRFLSCIIHVIQTQPLNMSVESFSLMFLEIPSLSGLLFPPQDFLGNLLFLLSPDRTQIIGASEAINVHYIAWSRSDGNEKACTGVQIQQRTSCFTFAGFPQVRGAIACIFRGWC